MSKLTVVIPALNEREAIGQVVTRTLAARGALRRAGVADLEVLVVDDGSTDGTDDVVRELATGAQFRRVSVRLLRHEANLGYGAAIQAGFKEASGDLLAFLDADSTYPPEELPALCQEATASGADLILGNRMHGRASQMPISRRIGNILYASLAGLLAGRPVADCCTGMRVLPVATWEKLGPLPAGLDFTPAMTMRALHQRLKLHEVSIPYHERVGHSKLKLLQDGVRFLASILHETWTHDPVRLWRVAVPVAASAMLIRLAVAAVQAANHHGYTLGLGVLLGAILFFLGASGWASLAISPLSSAIQGRIAVQEKEERAS